MAGPIDPRLLRRARATKGYLVAGVGVGSATAILTIVQAWLLSRSVGEIFDTTWAGATVLSSLWWAVPGLAAVFGGKALLSWLNIWLAQRAAAAVKSQLRIDIMTARLRRPCEAGTSTSSLMTLITQGLDALDGYFSKYLPQLALALTVPIIIGTAVLSTDFWSALTIALTLPLIPFMMALVGWSTSQATSRRWKIQMRLAGHFADLVEGLPTLQVFGRAKAQLAGLRATESRHINETLKVLRISFLSALVLELLATISVAIVAVTIGFRVLYYQMDLTTALFILILAPEVYLPVRQVGVHYHDSADGVAAAASAFAVIEAGDQALGGSVTPPAVRDSVIDVAGVGHAYGSSTSKDAEGSVPVVSGVSFTVAPGQLCVLTGPSGGGKTTVLNAIMGFLSPTEGEVLVAGQCVSSFDVRAWQRQLAYVGQNPGLVNGDIATNLRLANAAASDAALRSALDAAGGHELELAHQVGDNGEGLSAGERRRVAMARALLFATRPGGDVGLLLLDEPTAGLDADTELAVIEALRNLGLTAIVVSHRPAVIEAADVRVEIGVPAAA